MAPPRMITICVIGGGAGGLATLKAIMDTQQYKAGLWDPTLFESRENVGGVWLPAPPNENPPVSPLYDSLTTNLPLPVMAFSSFPFPHSTLLFPEAAVVQSYLESYCSHFNLASHIRLNTTVQDVQRYSSKWKVEISSGEHLDFDFVVVANGHHRIPRYPNISGLSDWLAMGRASHSAWYRSPRNLGRSVLVVGAGPSGLDITSEMCTISEAVVHSSPGAIPEDVGKLKRRGRVAEFKCGGQVVFEDGTVESGIDHCILATGYQIAFPFFQHPIMKMGLPPPTPPLPYELYNSSFHVFPLAKHMFPIHGAFPPASLVFMGLLIRVAPLPLLEAQARVVVKVFAQPDSLDINQETIDINSRYQALKDRFGDNPELIAKTWHRFEKDEQFDYRDQLYEFAEADSDRQIVISSQWEKDMYNKKVVLRSVWRDLVGKGKADEWVNGVGKGGSEEWVALMEKMVRRAQLAAQDGMLSIKNNPSNY